MGVENAAPVNPPANPQWRTMNGSVAGPPGQWSTGCSDCCDDGCFNCIMASCFPCVPFGQNAEIVDGTNCAVAGAVAGVLLYFGIMCVYTFTYRTKIRERFQIPGSPAGDCCMHCWCGCCAILQEARELKVHGMTRPNSMNPPLSYGAPPPVQMMAQQPYAQPAYPQPPH